MDAKRSTFRISAAVGWFLSGALCGWLYGLGGVFAFLAIIGITWLIMASSIWHMLQTTQESPWVHQRLLSIVLLGFGISLIIVLPGVDLDALFIVIIIWFMTSVFTTLPLLFMVAMGPRNGATP